MEADTLMREALLSTPLGSRRGRGKQVKSVDSRIMDVRKQKKECMANCRAVAKSGIETIKKIIKEELSKLPKAKRGRKALTEAEKAERKQKAKELRAQKKQLDKELDDFMKDKPRKTTYKPRKKTTKTKVKIGKKKEM